MHLSALLTSASSFMIKTLIGVMIAPDKVRRHVVTLNRRSERDTMSLYAAVSITAGGGRLQLSDHNVMNC